MKAISFVIGRINRVRTEWAKTRCLREAKGSEEIYREDWDSSLADPLAFYLHCFRYFHCRMPAKYKEHRAYFSAAGRGFGEDAFHVMWWLLFREFRPRLFLEIGVYRGQTLSLLSLLQQEHGISGEVVGISPFQPVGDRVSRYREDVQYLEDTQSNFTHFSLPQPTLLKAYSSDPVAVACIRSRSWDCIYIDGNHDYEVVKADWAVCSETLREGGLIVMDDSGLSSSYRPPIFSTGGHPGPSQVAQEVDPSRFREILQVGHNRAFLKIRQ